MDSVRAGFAAPEQMLFSQVRFGVAGGRLYPLASDIDIATSRVGLLTPPETKGEARPLWRPPFNRSTLQAAWLIQYL
jgi:hypothetical protein